MDDFEFVPSLVPHDSLSPEVLDEFDTFLLGCTCSSSTCCSANPTCTCQSRVPFAYDSQHRLKSEYLSNEGTVLPPIIECGALCECDLTCENRVVGRGPRLNLIKEFETRSTPPKGWGLFIRTFIPVGTFICEYAGEVVSITEARRRTPLHSDTYLFAVQERSHVASVSGEKEGVESPEECHEGQTTFIDARLKGNWGRFINHSCDPNTVLLPVRVDIVIPRLSFFAKRNVKAGEELTVDYGRTGGIVEPERISDVPVVSRKECGCLSKNCRKFLPFESDFFS